MITTPYDVFHNRANEKCECCNCGYEWIKGHDGSHSCSQRLNDVIDETVNYIKFKMRMEKSNDREILLEVKRLLENRKISL